MVDPTPFPPGSPPANDKRDYTYTTYWTETLTETLSIPAVTFSLTTTTQTLPPETFTNTWTRIVTTHVTVTEPTPTTLASKLFPLIQCQYMITELTSFSCSSCDSDRHQLSTISGALVPSFRESLSATSDGRSRL